MFDNRETGRQEYYDIKGLFSKLIKSWPYILVSILICFTAAAFYIFYATPGYHVKAKILIQDQKKNGQSSSSGIMDLGSLLGTSNSVDNEVEVLNTRYLMDRLVRSRALNIVWFKKVNFKKIELESAPYEIKIHHLDDSVLTTSFAFEQVDKKKFKLSYEDPIEDSVCNKIFTFEVPFYLPHFGSFSLIGSKQQLAPLVDEVYSFEISSYDSRVEQLRENLLISSSTNKLASTIDIQFDYPVSSKGEWILGNYIDEYIRQDVLDRSRIADSTIKFIDERILLVNDELDQVERNIQKFMQGKGLANISEQARLLLASNTDYTKQIAGIENKIQILSSIESLVQDSEGQKIVSGDLLGDDPTFTSLVSTYNSLSLEKERLLLSYTFDNPFVVNTDKRIEAVKANILSYIKTTKENLEVSKKDFLRSTGLIKLDIKDVPAQEREFLDLSRQQQLKQELYLYLLQKREETAVANTSNIAGIRLIDPPKADYKPFRPRKIIVLGLMLFLSLLFPTAWIYLKELFNTKVENRKDIEKRTQVPVIAEFSHNATKVDLIEFKSSRSALSEQFRALRTNLQFMMPRPGDKVILITSGMPGEGKSFTSLNLANIYAVSGKKVLLLEFDLRKPKLSKTYAGFNGVGISNYIVDQSLHLKDFINSVGDTGNLFFGACGPIPPNPAELILSPRVRQMIEEARDQFDFVIIDAPPLGAVTDGQMLSEYADVTLHMVRAGYTPHELVGLPEDIRQEGKIKNMAIILNDINDANGGYYGYNYGYYMPDEEAKKPWWKFWKKG